MRFSDSSQASLVMIRDSMVLRIPRGGRRRSLVLALRYGVVESVISLFMFDFAFAFAFAFTFAFAFSLHFFLAMVWRGCWKLLSLCLLYSR
jgi:hypothetical protein